MALTKPRDRLKSVAWLLSGVGALFAHGLASAQDTHPQPSETADEAVRGETAEGEPQIIVRGERLNGVTIGGYQPELVLLPEDIEAYGAGSLAELAGLILAETSSSRGRSSGPPVVLINGRRVSGFREVGRYPVSALARVEVLPEEVSLAYGFAADQRVLNFVLKPNVKVTTVTARAGSPSEGDRFTGELDGQFLNVDGARRLSFDAAVSDSGALFEADRDLSFADGSTGSSDRTIAPAERTANVGFSASVGLPDEAVATASGSYTDTRQRDALGIAPDGLRRLEQTREISDLFAGFTVASGLGPSTWTITSNYSQLDQDTVTDLLTEAATRRVTSSRNETLRANALVNQRLANFAAGPFSLAASLDGSLQSLDNRVDDPGAFIEAQINRDRVAGRMSLDLPILLPEPLGGDVSLNANAEAAHLSDFDDLVSYGFGLRWRPTANIRLIASFTHDRQAPSLSSLGSPAVLTPNARIFDGAVGESILATQINGGNPALTPDRRDVFKLGLQWTPIDKPKLTLNLDYTASKIDDEVRSFTLLTPEFEAAFPERVVRDGQGQLLTFDARPVQVASARRSDLRAAVSFSNRLKSKRKRRVGPAPAKRRRSGRPGSLRMNLTYRLALQDTARLTDAPDSAQFDFLGGSAGERLGGTPRHRVDLSLYRWKSGFGFGLGAAYTSGTRVDAPEGALTFSDLAILNIRVTYEFNYSDPVLNALPFLEETQVALAIGNVLNQRQRVRDAFGNTPDNLQPEFLDPLGRTVRIDWRRQF